MPLFFFISGFFVYSATYSWSLYKRRLSNRLRSQLFSTIVFWLLFCIGFSDVTVAESTKDHFKSGYWFTFVAVEFFLLYSPVFVLFTIKNFSDKARNIFLAVYTAVLLSIGFVGDRYLNFKATDIWGILSLSDLFLYLPYFYLGIFFKMNSGQLMKVLSNKYMFVSCLIVFFASLSIPMNFIVHIICAVAAIVVVHFVFMRLSMQHRAQNSKISHYLEYIGTMTLEIYLLHYFIIEGIKFLPGVSNLESLKNTPMELPVYMLFSAAIISACLALVYIMKKFGLYNYAFPKARRSIQLSTVTIND